jgi:hypothetical protein
VRDSTDSIDELVQRNIQEVLAAVQQQEVELGKYHALAPFASLHLRRLTAAIL